jgi:hypothetical protein
MMPTAILTIPPATHRTTPGSAAVAIEAALAKLDPATPPPKEPPPVRLR